MLLFHWRDRYNKVGYLIAADMRNTHSGGLWREVRFEIATSQEPLNEGPKNLATRNYLCNSLQEEARHIILLNSSNSHSITNQRSVLNRPVFPGGSKP